MIKSERNKIDAITHPKTPEEVALSILTEGTFLNKKWKNLRSENVAVEDLLSEILACIQTRSFEERQLEALQLQDLLAMRDAKANENGQFALLPDYHKELHDKAELQAELDSVTKSLAQLEEKRGGYIVTIVEETRKLKQLETTWNSRQEEECHAYLGALKEEPQYQAMATPEMEKAFKVVAPSTLLQVNPDLIQKDNALFLNMVNDLMRELRVLSTINNLQREVSNEDLDNVFLKPTDIKRLLDKNNKLPPIPRHTEKDESETKQAIDAAKKRRHAEIGLRIVKEEILVKEKEHNHLMDLINAYPANIIKPTSSP